MRTNAKLVTKLAFLGLLGSLLTTSGCDRQGEHKREARLLLTQLEALHDEPSLAGRKALLDHLEQLRLSSPTHDEARTLCTRAHRDLLVAELEQAEAKRALAEAGEGEPARALPEAQRQAVAAAIARSDAALEGARKRFPECERAMQALVTAAR